MREICRAVLYLGSLLCYIKLVARFNFLLSLLVVAYAIFMMLLFKAKEEFRVYSVIVKLGIVS